VLPTPTLIHWMRRLPHVQFTNLYGPTEATICSSYYTVPRCPTDPREPIPIGTACEGERLLILDERLQPVADGEIGDLYIAGVGLSPGYWRNPKKTRSAFIAYANGADAPERTYRTGDRARRAASGLYQFCGREDMQIKSRGYRIELGEIEAALHTLPELRESAVVAIESEGFAGAQICCAYVAEQSAASAAGRSLAESLRRSLGELVPPYMLPFRWRRYEALPKNPNGKLDRSRLRQDFSQAPENDPAERREPAASHARWPDARSKAGTKGLTL
jgi:acyl-coenzyme A synthetase/AMP-(fatty) acid ligase